VQASLDVPSVARLAEAFGAGDAPPQRLRVDGKLAGGERRFDAGGDTRRYRSCDRGAFVGGTSGALWGMLLGLLFFNPLVGMALGAGVGAASGALGGKLSDYGINDNFIRELGSTITPNSSALFLLVRKVTADKVLARMSEFKGRVLRTSLPDEQEKRLREALGDTAPSPA
jgi:uncharacterized membrane protein